MAASSSTQSNQRNVQPTAPLYDRLGGASGIAALVDDIVAAHIGNPVIKARFLPYLEKPERVNEVKQHMRHFLGAGSGGPEQYSGRSMPEAHRGMNISEAEYLAVIDDILGVLKQHGIDEQTQKDMLAIAYGFKEQILHV